MEADHPLNTAPLLGALTFHAKHKMNRTKISSMSKSEIPLSQCPVCHNTQIPLQPDPTYIMGDLPACDLPAILACLYDTALLPVVIGKLSQLLYCRPVFPLAAILKKIIEHTMEWIDTFIIMMVLVTKWVDKHTIPYTINNLSVLTP